MDEACEVIVYVRSRRTVAGVRETQWSMTVAYSPTTVVRVPVRALSMTYRRSLDEDQLRAVERARLLALAGGSPLRVVDLSRMHPLIQLLRSRLIRARSVPVVVVKGPCVWSPAGSPEGKAPRLRAAGRRGARRTGTGLRGGRVREVQA